jgi:hypothetical protein
MRGSLRQVLRRHPHRRLRRVPPSFAHRHRRQCSTQDQTSRSLIQRFIGDSSRSDTMFR